MRPTGKELEQMGFGKMNEPEHIKQVAALRMKLIDIRAEFDGLSSLREHMAPVHGSLTCAICYLADDLETLRRWANEHAANAPIVAPVLKTNRG